MPAVASQNRATGAGTLRERTPNRIDAVSRPSPQNAKTISRAIRHSVAEMALNDVVHIKDLHFPAGVRPTADGELLVVTVREVLEVVAEAAPAEGAAAEPEVIGKKVEPGEEGAAAEGAAGGKAAAKPDAKKKE